MNVAFWNLNFEILKVWCYCMLKKCYIICHLWSGIIDCKPCHTIETFEFALSFFQLVSFTSKVYVYPQQITYGKKKFSENGLYEAVFAYIFRIYRYMHDKEYIFVSLVKCVLTI